MKCRKLPFPAHNFSTTFGLRFLVDVADEGQVALTGWIGARWDGLYSNGGFLLLFGGQEILHRLN
jgi:hypothetical protein